MNIRRSNRAAYKIKGRKLAKLLKKYTVINDTAEDRIFLLEMTTELCFFLANKYNAKCIKGVGFNTTVIIGG